MSSEQLQKTFSQQLRQVEQSVLRRNPSKIQLPSFIIKGKIVNGKLNGKGEILDRYSKGLLYEGSFKDNKKNGKGKEIDGNIIYEGNFKNDKKDGQGKLSYSHGPGSSSLHYSGSWKNNKMNGKGTEYYRLPGKKNNKVGPVRYVGDWKDNKMHGKGKMYSLDGELIYNGDWKNGNISPVKQTKPSRNDGLHKNISYYASLVRSPVSVSSSGQKYLEKIASHVVSNFTQSFSREKIKEPNVVDAEDVVENTFPEEFIEFGLEAGQNASKGKYSINASPIKKLIHSHSKKGIHYSENVIAFITGVVEYVFSEVIESVPSSIVSKHEIQTYIFDDEEEVSKLMQALRVK